MLKCSFCELDIATLLPDHAIFYHAVPQHEFRYVGSDTISVTSLDDILLDLEAHPDINEVTTIEEQEAVEAPTCTQSIAIVNNPIAADDSTASMSSSNVVIDNIAEDVGHMLEVDTNLLLDDETYNFVLAELCCTDDGDNAKPK